jgi:hypothetical protein
MPIKAGGNVYMTQIDYVIGIIGCMALPVVISWLFCKIKMIGD